MRFSVVAGKPEGRADPSRWLWLVVALWVTTITGCALRQRQRQLEKTYPPAQIKRVPTSRPAARAVDSYGVPNPSASGSPPLTGADSVSAPSLPGTASVRSGANVAGGDASGTTAIESGLQVPAPLVIPPPSGQYPIDMATALRLADVSNPTIAAARTMILEALALQLTARSLLLPSLNAGVSYHDHNGPLQRSSGKILELTQQSLYVGAGAKSVTAETITIPGVNIFSQLADAWFEPLAARQRVRAARFAAGATANEILLDVALLEIELLGNQSLLQAQRLSESQAYEIVRITRAFADTEEGRRADAERAQAEWRYRRAAVQKAEEAIGVTAARLANRLNLDPAIRLRAVGDPLVPLHLIDLDTPPQELIKIALERRPDLAARTAEIAQAEAYRREEISRPLLPTLWLGFSGGVFGGGSNVVPPLLGDFAGRTDFDVRVYWTLLNFGAGNLSLIRRRAAEVGQAVAARQQTINRARSEVMAALADARAAQNEIDLARRELASAQPGFREDLARARDNEGRPIEVVNSLVLLARSRVDLIRALVNFDQAQYRLWVALGSPPPLS
jgi:outer membrane protein TolC